MTERSASFRNDATLRRGHGVHTIHLADEYDNMAVMIEDEGAWDYCTGDCKNGRTRAVKHIRSITMSS